MELLPLLFPWYFDFVVTIYFMAATACRRNSLYLRGDHAIISRFRKPIFKSIYLADFSHRIILLDELLASKTNHMSAINFARFDTLTKHVGKPRISGGPERR